MDLEKQQLRDQMEEYKAQSNDREKAMQVRNPSPCTMHPMPYTLYPAPYILQPTPYTLHLEPYILHLEPVLVVQGYLAHKKQRPLRKLH